ncbi:MULTISPECIES: uracil-DNA glycosylase [Burkholderiaceae]|uniref:uracil-DNA glycosylase n=1 Tax=Burkholderiaceae TaxID=119060 RepID=UPI0016188983|nr:MULTISPECIES: uracil-DNA glycosylase [Burkholderiaceae]MBB2981412.1 hypothetical protein [Paraburkholderia tropica]
MADQIDAPRTLRDPQAIAQRRAMLAEPHIAPLALYVQGLRAQHPTWEFQDFDPLDGGVQADTLFLLEKPGPMTSPNGKKQGSGFISRNNDDPTAEAVFRFMEEAGIPRKRTALWNVIPWWDKSIKFTSAEVRRGIEELRNLLPLLPAVRTVVLVGGQARRALPMLQALRPDLRICTSAHPARQVYRFNPEQSKAIPAQWRAAVLVQDEARAEP